MSETGSAYHVALAMAAITNVYQMKFGGGGQRVQAAKATLGSFLPEAVWAGRTLGLSHFKGARVDPEVTIGDILEPAANVLARQMLTKLEIAGLSDFEHEVAATTVALAYYVAAFSETVSEGVIKKWSTK